MPWGRQALEARAKQGGVKHLAPRASFSSWGGGTVGLGGSGQASLGISCYNWCHTHISSTPLPPMAQFLVSSFGGLSGLSKAPLL